MLQTAWNMSLWNILLSLMSKYNSFENNGFVLLILFPTAQGFKSGLHDVHEVEIIF